MIPVNTRGVARYAKKKIQKFVAKCVKISSQSLYISDLLCVIILLAKNGPKRLKIKGFFYFNLQATLDFVAFDEEKIATLTNLTHFLFKCFS